MGEASHTRTHTFELPGLLGSGRQRREVAAEDEAGRRVVRVAGEEHAQLLHHLRADPGAYYRSPPRVKRARIIAHHHARVFDRSPLRVERASVIAHHHARPNYRSPTREASTLEHLASTARTL